HFYSLLSLLPHLPPPRPLPSFPTRRSSDLPGLSAPRVPAVTSWDLPPTEEDRLMPSTPDLAASLGRARMLFAMLSAPKLRAGIRSEEHTSELQSRFDLVCRLLLEKKKSVSV